MTLQCNPKWLDRRRLNDGRLNEIGNPFKKGIESSHFLLAELISVRCGVMPRCSINAPEEPCEGLRFHFILKVPHRALAEEAKHLQSTINVVLDLNW